MQSLRPTPLVTFPNPMHRLPALNQPPQSKAISKRKLHRRLILLSIPILIFMFIIVLVNVITSNTHDPIPDDPINPIPPHFHSFFSLHFIDVGQGDATLLIGSHNSTNFSVLIDTGRWQTNDVVPYLISQNIDHLDLVIITHPHADHIGQLPSVLHNFQVDEVWMSGTSTTSQTFLRALRATLQSNALYKEPRYGDSWNKGGLALEVLNPTFIGSDLHAGCVCVRAVYGDFKAVFTGDAEESTERAMNSRKLNNLSAQLLKLGHHGSFTSSTESFVDAVNPKIAIYSASATNGYGHPSPVVLERLADRGIPVFGTAERSTIVVDVKHTGGDFVLRAA
ncbi:hypothetical protein P9112_011832 [Eukaryota sp. TZLM1-RC]